MHLLFQRGSIVEAKWPIAGSIDEIDIKRSCYLMDAAHSFRLFYKNYMAAASKGKSSTPAVKPTHGTIFVAKQFPPWQSSVLITMKELYDVSYLNIKTFHNSSSFSQFQHIIYRVIQ